MCVHAAIVPSATLGLAVSAPKYAHRLLPPCANRYRRAFGVLATAPSQTLFSDIVVRVSGVIAAVHLMGSLGEKSRADHARNDDRESENSECC